MKNSVRIALAAGLMAGMSLFAVSASGAADTGPKVSKAVGTPLSEAQKAMQANDLATAMAKVKEAQAVPSRTADDDYVINEFLANIAIGQKDFATADTAYEAMADSPVLQTDPNKANTLHNALILAVSQKHFPKALQYGQALAALGPIDAKTAAAMSEAYYYTNDYPHALEMAKKAIDASKAAGQLPDRGALQIMMNSQANAKDEAGAEATLEELALDYNDPSDWGQLLDIALGTKGLRDIDALYINRLRAVVGANGRQDDYLMTANIAIQMGFPGEARSTLENGISKGVVSTSGKAGALLSTARAKASVDEKSLPAQEAAAAKQGGEYNVKLAEAEYGYGRYQQAEAAARRAQQKGGVKDPTEAAMVLGQALVGEGRYADAVPVFQSVNGGPGVNRAAHLWLVYAQHKAGASTASATPAAGGAQ